MISGLICLGDSVLAGTGASDRQYGSAKQIKKMLSCPVSIKSKNRDTSDMLLSHLQRDVLNQDRIYSHVVVLIGNNDCWLKDNLEANTPLDQFKKNLHLIISTIKQNRRTPFLCNLQPIDRINFFHTFPDYKMKCVKKAIDPFSWQEQYNSAIEETAKSMNIFLVDIRNQLSKDGIKETISLDGIHPNDFGHQIIASSIVNIFSQLSSAELIPRLQ
jgi:lysophospholipase L1-like esterase